MSAVYHTFSALRADPPGALPPDPRSICKAKMGVSSC